MKIQKYKNNKGFTLVEALFAIFILTFTITGLMVIVADSLFSARYAKDEITANYLLQEAVDYIRNDRDTTVFLRDGSSVGGEEDPNVYWNNFINKYTYCTSLDGCYLNVSEKEIERCNDSGTGNDNKCPFLYYNDKNTSENYFYAGFKSDDIMVPSGFIKTNFQRKIFFKEDDDNDGMIVTVTLNWKNGSVPIERTLSTVLMSWQK